MNRVSIDRERCKGCGLCVSFCPKKILVLLETPNTTGYCPASCVEETRCIACANCASICPEAAFEIYKDLCRAT